MKFQTQLLIGGNLSLLCVIIFMFQGSDKSKITLQELELKGNNIASQIEAGEVIKNRKKEFEKKRKERLSAQFFLPIPGERNALSDMIDGAVIEKINRNMPVARSFRKLLVEENPELTKEEINQKLDQFKDMMSLHLQESYKIKRGLEEGDLNANLLSLKTDLQANLGLSGTRLERLIEIERAEKSKRQLGVFEKTLIKSEDKLTAPQREEMLSMLSSRQFTVFDESRTIDDHFEASDGLVEDVSQCLKPSQVEHFKYFQEFHWHANDMPEVNDLPGMF